MRSLARFFLISILAVPAAASTAVDQSRDQLAQPVDETEGDQPTLADSRSVEAMSSALQDAIQSGWQELHLVVGCPAAEEVGSLEVFGDGVAVWNLERQLELPPEVVRAMLTALIDGGFAAMPEAFGGESERLKSRKTPAQNRGAGAEVVCHVALELDGLAKRVVQMRKGDQSTEFRRLARHLLDLARPYVDAGLSANSLDDALAKVADGRLAPQLFSVSVQRKPMGGQTGKAWVLSVRSMRAKARAFDPGSGTPQAKQLQLEPERVRALAGLARDGKVEAMPVNLWGEIYTDFDIGVMRWRKSIQARQFDGMEPAGRAEQQEAFSSIISELEMLEQQVEDEGELLAAAPATE